MKCEVCHRLVPKGDRFCNNCTKAYNIGFHDALNIEKPNKKLQKELDKNQP